MRIKPYFKNVIAKFIPKRLHIDYPIEIAIEPTVLCNQSCPMCDHSINRIEEIKCVRYLSWETFKKLSPIFAYVKRVNFSGFGEPLLHPDFIKMAYEVKKQNNKIWLYFFTNGQLLDKKISTALINAEVDEICVSIGGATEETHRKTHGGNFDNLISNLKILNNIKSSTNSKKPHLALNIPATNSVLRELSVFFDLAAELDVDTFIMIPFVVFNKNLINESPWLDIAKARDMVDKATKKAISMKFKFIPPNLTESNLDCNRFFTSMMATWDGKVLSCCMEAHLIGDLKDNSIFEIWNGKPLITLRQRYYKEGIQKVCPDCTSCKNFPKGFLRPRSYSRSIALDNQSIY